MVVYTIILDVLSGVMCLYAGVLNQVCLVLTQLASVNTSQSNKHHLNRNIFES